MTRTSTILATIGWTRKGLADRLGCHHSLVARWTGDAPVAADTPPDVLHWLECLAHAHACHPEPIGWKRQGTKAA